MLQAIIKVNILNKIQYVSKLEKVRGLYVPEYSTDRKDALLLDTAELAKSRVRNMRNPFERQFEVEEISQEEAENIEAFQAKQINTSHPSLL
jgi:hypothetical protein